MKYRIIYLPRAIIDRDEIKTYLSNYYSSTARKFFKLLKERTNQLKEFPYSCPVYQDEPNYRILIVDNYLVFYIVDEKSKVIEIHRIFHSSQDIIRYL